MLFLQQNCIQFVWVLVWLHITIFLLSFFLKQIHADHKGIQPCHTTVKELVIHNHSEAGGTTKKTWQASFRSFLNIIIVYSELEEKMIFLNENWLID